MIYIKDHYTVLKYEAALFSLFSAVWTPPHIDISKAANLRVSLPAFWSPVTEGPQTFHRVTDGPPEKFHRYRDR